MADELTRYAARRLGHSASEDVVSDVFLVVWRRWDSLPADHDGRRAWAYEALKRTMLHHQRRERSRAALSARVRAQLTSAEAERPESSVLDEASVGALLDALPDRERAVVELVYLHGHTVKETAHALGLGASAVKMRLSRARARLAAALTREEQ